MSHSKNDDSSHRSAPNTSYRVLPTAGPHMFSRRTFLTLSGTLLITTTGLSLLAGCGPAPEGTVDLLKNPKKKSHGISFGDGKIIRVGMEAAYAPYNWQTSTASDTTIPIQNVQGAYADGYDVQFAKIVAKAFGLEAVAVKMAFSGLIDALNHGQIDIIMAGMSTTDERRQAIDFSDPYFEGGFGLLVKKDSRYASARSLKDFSGAAVLGQKDTLLDTVIDEIPQVKHLTPVESVPSQLSQLNQGTCDAITFNTENEKGLLRVNPNLVAVSFAKGEGFKETIPCNAGIKKGQDELLAKLNKIFKGVSLDRRKEIFDACIDRQPT